MTTKRAVKTKTRQEKLAEAHQLQVKLPALMGKWARSRQEWGARDQLLAIANQLTRELLVGGEDGSFDDLLAQWELHNYRPTLRADLDPRFGPLADLYDFWQACYGRDVVAYRG